MLFWDWCFQHIETWKSNILCIKFTNYYFYFKIINKYFKDTYLQDPKLNDV